MLNFVIVEDNKNHRDNVKNIIMSYMMKNSLDFNIHIFNDVNSELNIFINDKKIHNKIYFLDFELPSGTAIDIARLIRESDWTSSIIIFTIHYGMALSSFQQRLQILDFVTKQFDLEKNLHELIDLCIRKIIKGSALTFTYKSISSTIPFKNILYIYRDERRIVVVTDDNKEYKFLSSISKVKKGLPFEFKICNKGTIINTSRIKNMCWKSYKITFDNGKESYLLSRNHRKELQEYGIR